MAQRPRKTAAIASTSSTDWSVFLVRSMELFVFSFTIYLLL